MNKFQKKVKSMMKHMHKCNKTVERRQLKKDATENAKWWFSK